MVDDNVESYRAAIQAAAICSQMLTQHDIPKLLEDISRAEALGPIMDPTLYREKARAMQQDKELLKAAAPLRELGVAMQRAAAAIQAVKGGDHA